MNLLHSNTETEEKKREKSERRGRGSYWHRDTAGKISKAVILTCTVGLIHLSLASQTVLKVRKNHLSPTESKLLTTL